MKTADIKKEYEAALSVAFFENILAAIEDTDVPDEAPAAELCAATETEDCSEPADRSEAAPFRRNRPMGPLIRQSRYESIRHTLQRPSRTATEPQAGTGTDRFPGSTR